MNVFQYVSPRVDELPKKFVDDIIEELNTLRAGAEYWRKRFDDAEEYYDLKHSSETFAYYRDRLRSAEMFLNSLELYPVWNMPGHRGTYHIPNYEECDMWEDYLYQCADY